MSPDEEAWRSVVTEAKQNLSLLEAQLKGKRFFGGDSIGLVDIAASMLAHWLGVIEEVSGVVVLTDEEFPELCNWAKRYVHDETVKQCLPKRDELVAMFSSLKEMLEEGETRDGFLKEAKELLPLLEAQLKGKKFFNGDTPGYLDIAASMLGPTRIAVEEVTGVALINDDDYPALSHSANSVTLLQQFTKPFFMAHWLEEGEVRDGFVKEAKELLPLLEAQLKGKKFFNGDAPGYLDIAACTLGPTRIAIEELMGVSLINDDDYPALSQWARDYVSNEALKPCMPDRDQLLAYFTKNKERYTSAVKAMLQQ
ncbi:hypothetical protein EJB05_18807, partial [Eragrostis curvula]